MKALIIYIATGDYSTYFNNFKESLHRFLPCTEKVIYYVSDHTNFIEDVNLTTKTSQYCTSDNNKFKLFKRNVEHLPWPIIALMKFKYVLDGIEATKDEEITHVYYFNANVKFLKVVPESVFISSRLIAVEHSNLLVHCRNNTELLCKQGQMGLARIDHPYVYVASGALGGPVDKLKEAATEIYKWTRYDLGKNIIPDWHDESYWNKYIDIHKDEVKMLPAIYGCTEDDKYLLDIYDPAIVYGYSELTQSQKGK